MASTESLRAAPVAWRMTLPRASSIWLELGLLVAILAVAVTMRLVNLGAYSGLFDEGIRGEQLFLMSAGYRPFRDIFAAQGPLLLDLLHPWFVLFGQDLAAARLAVGLYSLIGMAGASWVGRLVGGPVGGIATALLLLLSALYLEGSRLALAEVPAMAPAILSVGTGLLYAREGSRRWLFATALLLATSLLMKPITLAACVPIGLACLARGRRGIVDLCILGVVVGAVMVAVVFAVGVAGVLDQIVSYRLESRGSEGWSFWKNRAALARALSFEQTALLGLAAGGSVLLLARRRLAAFCLVAWAVASVGLLLAYSPLHGKHAVVMIPPMALVAGTGLGAAWHEVRGSSAAWARGLIAFVAFLLLGWYALTAPAGLAQSGQVMKVTADSDVDPALEQYADAVDRIAALSGPRDFVVTDHPYLTFLAGRLVPPALVDTSRSRIRSRSLRSGEAVAIAAAHEPRLVVLWTDRLRALGGFKAWVEDNYRLVAVYNRRQDLDRGIYVRRDADFSAVRVTLEGRGFVPAGADFGGDLRLVSRRLERHELRRGEGASVTLHWESLRPLGVDYHVLTVLRSSDGQAWDQQQESLAGGSVGTTEWEVGRWLFQNTFVRTDADVPVGEYTIAVSAYDSRSRRPVPLEDGQTELVIGQISVR